MTIEVGVLNNGSADEIFWVQDEFPGTTSHTHSQNTGLSGNFFSAFNSTEAEWLWILADDDMPVTTWISSLDFKDIRAGQLVLKRKDSSMVTLCEDRLQRVIGLPNSVYHVARARQAIQKIQEMNLSNDTYPQVLLSQAIGDYRLVDLVSYVDSQPDKNYGVESFLRVVIRDVCKLAHSAKLLDVPGADQALITKLAISHLANYSPIFLSKRTSREAKIAFVASINESKPFLSGALRRAALLVAFAVKAASHFPSTAAYTAILFIGITGQKSRVASIRNGRNFDGDRAYFGYDPN